MNSGFVNVPPHSLRQVMRTGRKSKARNMKEWLCYCCLLSISGVFFVDSGPLFSINSILDILAFFNQLRFLHRFKRNRVLATLKMKFWKCENIIAVHFSFITHLENHFLKKVCQLDQIPRLITMFYIFIICFPKFNFLSSSSSLLLNIIFSTRVSNMHFVRISYFVHARYIYFFRLSGRCKRQMRSI